MSEPLTFDPAAELTLSAEWDAGDVRCCQTPVVLGLSDVSPHITPSPYRGRKDLTGQTVNGRVIYSFAGKALNGTNYWNTHCSCCRKLLVVSTANIRSTSTCRSCWAVASNRRRRGRPSPRHRGGFGEIPGSFWHQIVNGARSRSLQVSVTIREAYELYIRQNRRCAYSGIPIYFCWSVDHRRSTASLDRIDSTSGYIPGNVQWVHKDVNFMKQDLSDSAFRNWCSLITRKSEADFHSRVETQALQLSAGDQT